MQLLAKIVPTESVFEVGSTAVAGIIGKQDLDFLVRVPPEKFQATRAALDQAFTRNPEQLSNAIYQGYIVESNMDVAIQLTIEDGPFDNFLAFLDRLRESAELRQEYNELKRQFDGALMADYREAKQVFIERVLASDVDVKR